jgi:hypothetical protein
MRNKAGFLGLALLLLTIPALANAWNLTVKVAGGDTSNYTTASYGTSTKDMQSGTFYLYPQAAVALATTGAAPTTIKLDGGASTTAAAFVSPTTGNHTLTITYPAAVVDTGASIALAQNLDGGQLYAQNRNNTWSYTGVTGLANLATVPVYIVADGNHKIVSYNLGAGNVTTGITGAAGQSLPVTAAATSAGTAVTAVFGLAARTSVSLFAPSNGFTTTPVNCSVTASSNDTGLQYAFSVNGAAYSAASTTSTFSFTPTTVGTYTVKAKVTSAADAVGVIAFADVIVTDAVVNVNQGCVSCHSTQSPTIVAAYTASIHGQSTHSACAACHTTATPHSAGVNALNIDTKGFFTFTSNVTGPKGPVANGAIFCTQCHSTIPHQTTNLATGINCNVCHTSTTGKGGSGDAHAIQGTSCQGCHAVGQSNPFTDKNLVNDNAGVRAVTGEFTKWSHHIVNAPGVAIQDEQCAVCHLEGTVGMYGFGVDGTKHMVDSVTHLRNAHDDTDMQWDPAAPNHTTMDNFCMACHSATGATSAMNLKLQALITPLTGTTASPSNPFGDTISNQYDKMLRPAVVNVSDQFNTTNNSHHGVKGPRYSGRTRVGSSRVVAATFNTNSSATLPGARTTIFDAGKFNALYVPIGTNPATVATTGLGDDSTLHCGDCHTVGQFAPLSATNANGSKTTVAIGAHGSANEYMLRNSIGTDARHQGIQMDASAMHADAVTPYLVCYNCHAIANYGLSSHIGEQVVGENNCDTPTNTNTVNAVGTDRITSQYTMSYGANVVGTPTGATNGNIYGIQCNNCHNSGISAGNIFGGIHGSADATYTDGAGNTTKHERFLPGLGNVMYAPGTRGGITGGTTAFQSYSSKIQTSGISKGLRLKGTYSFTTGGVTNDTNWEEKSRIPVGDGVTGWSHNPGAAGCYTISEEAVVPYNAESNGVPAGVPASLGLTAPNGTTLPGVWGGCVDHGQQVGSSVRQPRNTNTSIRPVTY